MSFEARVYIQGVGVYRRQGGGQKVHVLFPDQNKATERNIGKHKEQPLCRHHAAVQFSARYLEPSLPDAWTSIDITGLWVSLSAEPEGPPVETRLTTADGRVAGVPHLPDILENIKPIQPAASAAPLDAALRQGATPDSSQAELLQAGLRAGLVLDAGILSPYAEYEGIFNLDVAQMSRWPKGYRYSSVLKLELGQAKSFALHFQPFGSDKVSTLRLSTPWDELDVWIRHYCDLERPDPDQDLPAADAEDTDFALNYALLEHLDAVLSACDNKLPVPKVASSWARGGFIGLESRKCMAASA